MPPFIKFTEESKTASGSKRTFQYVNVEFILRATFHDATEELDIILASDPKTKSHTLKGQEAKDALEVLQKL